MKTHEINQGDILGEFPIYLKDHQGSSDPDKNSMSDIDVDQEDKPEKIILCKTCEHKITTPDHKSEIFGAFQHSFLNPAGHVFEIGCFSEARGCLVIGIPTNEWTWFPNCSWQVALCNNCNSHLGWYYSAERQLSFFGLILNTLI